MLFQRLWDYYDELPGVEPSWKGFQRWLNALDNYELMHILSSILGDFQ